MDGLTESQRNSPALSMFAGGGEMGELMRSHDWSSTPLGSVENWSPTLRTFVSNMLAFRFAQVIFWGEDYIQLYNDPMIATYGAHHPEGLGRPLRETWPEIWEDSVKPICEGIKTTGEAFFAEDQPYHVLRFGYWEETYFTSCYSPIRDETGKINGISCTSTETTKQVIRQRRLTMLRELATAGSGAKTLKSACLAAADTLNPYDIPFALFYQVNSQGNLAELVASSGLSADSTTAPPTITLTPESDTNDLIEQSRGWSLAQVLQSREPQLITDVVDRFGALPGGPWAESPRSALILPILSSNKEQVECLLVAGISPRLQFNSEYRSFLELVAQQVESSIATARSYEEERKRAEALAELDRTKTTFFSNVSHEFRTPLTLMLGLAEDALCDRDDPLSPHQQQRIEVMQRNGLRLLKLVNTLLDFSRIESDRISAVYELIDLATFTAELASVFRSAIERDIQSTASSGFPLFKGDGRGISEGDLGGSPSLKTVPTPSSARVLLVDDKADRRDYVRRLLSERWQVETATNGAIALDLIQQQLPDLVLTDVMMPEVDGFQLLNALRADPQTKSIPIILLSARAGEEATVVGLEAGADDYLSKPFSARELMARVETQLQMSRLRQERSAKRLKDEFLATLTHELNAPLAAILTWTRLLQTKPFDRPMMLRAMDAIERNASNQAKLIEDLLDMSSILAGERGLNPQPVDLVSIIDDVLNTLYPTAQAKAITLRYSIDDSGLDSDSPASQSIKSDEQLHNLKSKIPNPKLIVSGEPKRLRQIIANLLSNAIKFTPQGGQIKVQLNTDAGVTHLPPKSPQGWRAREAKFAQITISDTGIGISADFLPYAFDRFTQAEVPSRHTPGGVGIGLAIARHLVELHGGTIEVWSEGEGRGATFTVKLPLV